MFGYGRLYQDDGQGGRNRHRRDLTPRGAFETQTRPAVACRRARMGAAAELLPRPRRRLHVDGDDPVDRWNPNPGLRYSVRQNVWPDEARITFARSATKHRISRERSLYVIEHCGIQLVKRHPSRSREGPDKRVWFFGDDLEGVALEVLAAETEEEEFLVIHAMNLRNRFQVLYEEAKLWRK